jgi:hypothetical protein
MNEMASTIPTARTRPTGVENTRTPLQCERYRQWIPVKIAIIGEATASCEFGRHHRG